MNVVILGATGMLGDAVANAFSKFEADVYLTARAAALGSLERSKDRIPFDALTDALESTFGFLKPGDFIINCIGIIKTEIDETNQASRDRARNINAEFPMRLARFAEAGDLKVIQIATDCVFAGRDGSYTETSAHDPVDLYGETKSAGEVASENVMHLRVSIIGPEKRKFTSLYEWVARQKTGAVITGYTNHFWNGIPAKHFAKISRAIIEQNLFNAGVHHILPADRLSKAELVRLIAAKCGRTDVQVVDGNAETAIDRTLDTNDPQLNQSLWKAAGYSTLPSLSQLVSEI